MSKDYYRPVIAIRAVNYIDGDGKTHHHTLQFRREHSDQWVEVPVLNFPYGSDNIVDTDMAGYDWDSETVDDYEDWGEGENKTLEDHLTRLDANNTVLRDEIARLRNKIKSLKHEVMGWKELCYLKSEDY
jgi:hypothetical protein